jgi:hypothetical protein
MRNEKELDKKRMKGYLYLSREFRWRMEELRFSFPEWKEGDKKCV